MKLDLLVGRTQQDVRNHESQDLLSGETLTAKIGTNTDRRSSERTCSSNSGKAACSAPCSGMDEVRPKRQSRPRVEPFRMGTRQPIATVLTGLYDHLLHSPSCLGRLLRLDSLASRLSRFPSLVQTLPTLLGDEPSNTATNPSYSGCISYLQNCPTATSRDLGAA